MAEILKVGVKTPPESITKEEMTELLKRAESGDKTCLPRLRAVLQAEADGKRRGTLLETYGSPPTWLRNALVKHTSGGDLVVSEEIHSRFDQLRRELEGPNPTAIERLLAERATFCWFLVYRCEFNLEVVKELSLRQGDYHQRKIDAAHRRFLSSVRTLAQVRKLALPTLQLNIGSNQLNVVQPGGST
jgi:hypothetical protein